MNIILNVPVFIGNVKNIPLAIGFYSLWGSTITFFQHISTFLASNDKKWFKTAYYLTEIAYSVNFVIVIIFWGYMVPKEIERCEKGGKPLPTWEYYYNAVIHGIPFITSITDLYITDMALERDHTWIAFSVMSPAYMFFNWYAAVFVTKTGTIYGVEQWFKAPLETVGIFIIAGCIQAGIFWVSCPMFDEIWPMRPKEESNLKENLHTDEEDMTLAKPHVLV